MQVVLKGLKVVGVIDRLVSTGIVVALLYYHSVVVRVKHHPLFCDRQGDRANINAHTPGSITMVLQLIRDPLLVEVTAQTPKRVKEAHPATFVTSGYRRVVERNKVAGTLDTRRAADGRAPRPPPALGGASRASRR